MRKAGEELAGALLAAKKQRIVSETDAGHDLRVSLVGEERRWWVKVRTPPSHRIWLLSSVVSSRVKFAVDRTRATPSTSSPDLVQRNPEQVARKFRLHERVRLRIGSGGNPPLMDHREIRRGVQGQSGLR